MITSSNTEQHILKAMEHGAKLVYLWAVQGEMPPWLLSVTLVHNEKSINLTETTRYLQWQPDSECAENLKICPVADRIVKRSDIRRGYIYNSDYGYEYRELYEHCNQPVPRWVTEQWGFDNDGNPVAPDELLDETD